MLHRCTKYLSALRFCFFSSRSPVSMQPISFWESEEVAAGEAEEDRVEVFFGENGDRGWAISVRVVEDRIARSMLFGVGDLPTTSGARLARGLTSLESCATCFRMPGPGAMRRDCEKSGSLICKGAEPLECSGGFFVIGSFDA